MASPRGLSTFVISYSIFDQSGQLDGAGQRDHFRRLGDAGIGVYAVGGGSGEAYSLSPDEQERVLRLAAAELSGKVPIRAMGAPPRTAREMISFAQLVARSGLDAMQVYPPDLGMGHRPREAELAAYFDDVLTATKVPVVLSTHMSLGYLLPTSLIVQLANRYDSIIGVNCTTPDINYLAELLDAVGERLDVHVGIVSLTPAAIALGATGYLSSEGNLAPRLCQTIIEAYAAGDIARADDGLRRLIRLGGLSQRYGNVQAMKACLGILGLPGGVPRRPRLALDDPAATAHLSAVLEELEIPRIEQLQPLTVTA
jgi:4-hydroxy-tetrahydrodipicolinate synthase